MVIMGYDEVTTDPTDPRCHWYHPNPYPNRSYYCFSLLLYVYLILLHTPVDRRSVVLGVGGVSGDFSHTGY